MATRKPGSVEAALQRKRKGVRQRKKDISGRGKGKWETRSALARYRARRNKARKVARSSRRENRAA
jgi:hypothetical protein